MSTIRKTHNCVNSIKENEGAGTSDLLTRALFYLEYRNNRDNEVSLKSTTTMM